MFSPVPRSAAQDGQAILARQHEIQHPQVEAATIEDLGHFPAIGSGLHVETLFGEVTQQQLADAGVVVDEKYSGSRSHGVILTCKAG